MLLFNKRQENFKVFLTSKKENDLGANYFLALTFKMIAPFTKAICVIYGTISSFMQQKTTLFFFKFYFGGKFVND